MEGKVTGKAKGAEAYNGGRLFERPQPLGYVEEWLELMEQARLQGRPSGDSVMMFRLNDEWFGVPTLVVDRVAPIGAIHKLPFKSNLVVLGITNIEGELRIVISMRSLLGLENNITLNDKRLYSGHQRAIVVRDGLDYFVFPVDEVYGTVFFEAEGAEDIPMTASKLGEQFTKALFLHEGKRVGLLDIDFIVGKVKEEYL